MTTTMERPHGPGAASPTGDAYRTALAAVTDAVAGVRQSSTFGLADGEITGLVEVAGQAANMLEELIGRLVAEADARQLPKAAGSSSTTAWLMTSLGLPGGAAARVTRTALVLEAERVGPTHAAWADGRLSGDQAKVIADAVSRLSAVMEPAVVEQAQLRLIDQAGEMSFRELQRAANRLVEEVDPDRAEQILGELLEAEEDRARQQASFRFARGGDGTTRVSGRLPDAHADMLKKVLDAYAAPRRLAARDGARARTGNEHETLDFAAADSVGANADSDAGPLGLGEAEGDRLCDGVAGAPVEVAHVASAVLHPDGEFSTPMPYGTRLGLALMELVEHLPEDSLPQAGGGSATVVVTMDLDTLRGGLGDAVLDTGTEISAREARRMACNAGLVPMVLDGESRVLDVGREQRLYDPHQRVALAHRDGGCVWPGCDRPPAWCEAHHLMPWKMGGATDLDNGALVCGFHHRLLHAGEWHARLAADGVVEIIPPARLDPDRRPRRNARHRQRGRQPC